MAGSIIVDVEARACQRVAIDSCDKIGILTLLEDGKRTSINGFFIERDVAVYEPIATESPFIAKFVIGRFQLTKEVII